MVAALRADAAWMSCAEFIYAASCVEVFPVDSKASGYFNLKYISRAPGIAPRFFHSETDGGSMSNIRATAYVPPSRAITSDGSIFVSMGAMLGAPNYKVKAHRTFQMLGLPYMKTLAERIQMMLDETGYTQAQLAAACGVSRPSVNDWLSGKTKELKAASARRASEFLGVSFLWLTEGRGPMRSVDPVSGRDENHGAAPQHTNLLLSSNTQPEPLRAVLPLTDKWPLSEADYERFAALSPEGRAWALSQFAAGITGAEHMYPAERQANRA